jgi:hypothetical protein
MGVPPRRALESTGVLIENPCASQWSRHQKELSSICLSLSLAMSLVAGSVSRRCQKSQVRRHSRAEAKLRLDEPESVGSQLRRPKVHQKRKTTQKMGSTAKDHDNPHITGISHKSQAQSGAQLVKYATTSFSLPGKVHCAIILQGP